MLRRMFAWLFHARGDADKWRRLLSRLSTQQADLVVVHRVYQLARTGTKAIIRFEPSGKHQDSWFESRRVVRGEYLVITGHDGVGHHHKTLCRYVERGQLLARASKRDRRAYMRENSVS
ncbi:hypothetical protein [Amycolatopsis sp. CA-230715]|uniref:hypothetical protein n=1 Tax=Amycolatopsis sp. CA-230715 TaxID=2745196 RepID=UPI001C018BBD|nr:hypothetical protein [Amycolatopsis sp. CA-230715]